MSTAQAITACFCLLLLFTSSLTMGGQSQEEEHELTDKYLNKISTLIETTITGWHQGKGMVTETDQVYICVGPDGIISDTGALIQPLEIYNTQEIIEAVRINITEIEEEFKAAMEKAR